MRLGASPPLRMTTEAKRRTRIAPMASSPSPRTQHTHIELERDALGRVIEERQDRDWIRSEYDALGLRKRATSSKGFEQTIRRNSMGDVTAIEAGVHSLAPTGYDRRQRNPARAGPVSRQLRTRPFGFGARASTARRRPSALAARFAGTPPHARNHRWRHPPQHPRIPLGTQRPPKSHHRQPPRPHQVLSHDAVGNLASAVYADGHIDLRLPDAVGNLFKSPDKADRKYGPAGELLESTDARGTTRYRYDPEGYLIEKTRARRAHLEVSMERRRHARPRRASRR